MKTLYGRSATCRVSHTPHEEVQPGGATANGTNREDDGRWAFWHLWRFIHSRKIPTSLRRSPVWCSHPSFIIMVRDAWEISRYSLTRDGDKESLSQNIKTLDAFQTHSFSRSTAGPEVTNQRQKKTYWLRVCMLETCVAFNYLLFLFLIREMRRVLTTPSFQRPAWGTTDKNVLISSFWHNCIDAVTETLMKRSPPLNGWMKIEKRTHGTLTGSFDEAPLVLVCHERSRQHSANTADGSSGAASQLARKVE